MKIFCVVAVLTLLVVGVAAQGAPTVSQTFKPGDTLHFIVEFDGKPELDGLELDFALQDPLKKDQTGFSGRFPLYHLKAVSPGVFEIDGEIPKNAASGTYRLEQVGAVHNPGSRIYTAGDFPKVNLNVRNEAGYDFPPLKSITPTK